MIRACRLLDAGARLFDDRADDGAQVAGLALHLQLAIRAGAVAQDRAHVLDFAPASQLVDHIVGRLPPGPKYFPEDLVTDVPAAIWVAEGTRLVRRATAGSCARCHEACLREMTLDEGCLGHAFAAGEPVAIDDHRGGDFDTCEWIRQHGYVSFLAVPLLAEETIVGVLSLGAWQPHALSLHDMELLGAFGDQAAIAVGNARLYTTLSARVRRLRKGRSKKHASDEERETGQPGRSPHATPSAAILFRHGRACKDVEAGL